METTKVRSSGKKGQSLFHSFLIEAVEKEIQLIQNNYARHLSYLKQSKDDRLLAIVGSLAVEEAVDSLLNAYIPKYKILDADGRMPINAKTKLARSLKLIPEHLLKGVDVISKIRNEFAHNLHIDDFNTLPEKHKKGISTLFKDLHPEDDANSYALSRKFSTITSTLLVCFGAYASNLKLAKEYIYSDDFFLKIKDIVKSNSEMKQKEENN